MSVHLNPYIGFRDQAREALGFWHEVLGGELKTMTFAEGGMVQDPADAEKIMHGQLATPGGLLLMASDSPSSMPTPTESNVSVSLSGDDEDLLTGYWEGLADGATVIEPLTKAPWGDTFGMLTDRFGVTWLVNISGAAA
ncbi:3-demethylubiquinone-9 3-methyltransferase [Curtobacterium oceanosedimentum]|uniref:3-demethylubiquinone-9 3-methyltransferase n=1 Tax=Curtobacterium oceanosedimentum TaxID=465820 RepID=A0ABR5S5W0_9MICO|nr:VOC family protein [Curtobacterium oceanosedimentum]KTR38985.1 3-demethylubiquinone-9 3-methyltransferase [Curtobacterium oceanosedimentum]